MPNEQTTVNKTQFNVWKKAAIAIRSYYDRDNEDFKGKSDDFNILKEHLKDFEKLGINVNAVSPFTELSFGRSLATIAAIYANDAFFRSGNENTIFLLLKDKGADFNRPDMLGDTPFKLARNTEKNYLLKWLEDTYVETKPNPVPRKPPVIGFNNACTC